MRDLTYQQAFDFMNEIYEYDFCTDESNTTAQIRTDLELLCMKAILKQIPVKAELVDGRYICPSCRSNNRALDYYCDKCGQALDWSDL